MKVKILRISTVPHSLDLLLKGQLKYLTNNSFEIALACSYGEEMVDVAKRENATYYELPLSRELKPLLDIKALYYTIKLIRQLKPSIVHTHSPKAGIVGMLAAYICRVPVKIHTVAGLPLLEESGAKRKLLDFVERMTYRFADYILPNSNNLKDIILKDIYKNANKLTVIGSGSSNGIDLNYFKDDKVKESFEESFKIKYGIKEDDLILTFVGRLTFYKGVNELVAAFSELNKKYSNLKLILVGPFEELNPLENETINSIETNPNIISVGHQQDIRPYLKMSKIFVFPSYREGFPQSLMQAAAMNLACIATDINGCNEILEDNVTGLLIPVKNSSAIYNACEKLITDPHLRAELANKARFRMEEDFEQIDFWNKIIDFYNKALDKK